MTILTVNGLALRQVAIILACQESIAVAPNNPLNVAIVDIEEKAFHLRGCRSSLIVALTRCSSRSSLAHVI